jgi:hypothetical protein
VKRIFLTHKGKLLLKWFTINDVMINKPWHDKNPMPKNPSLEQRMKWHLAHAKNCGCRPIPPKLKAEILNRTGKTQ